MDPGLRKLGASCCRSDGRSRLGVQEGVGWWVGRDRGAYGLCAPLEWEAEVKSEAVVEVAGRWWRRLAVRVNGSRGLGGWAGFFLALLVFWTSWSWEDGRRRSRCIRQTAGSWKSWLSNDFLRKKEVVFFYIRFWVEKHLALKCLLWFNCSQNGACEGMWTWQIVFTKK